jgi:hypothetical protein
LYKIEARAQQVFDKPPYRGYGIVGFQWRDMTTVLVG